MADQAATSAPRPVRASPAWRSISVKELGRLAELSREDLVAEWTAIYGTPPPRGIKRPLLERSLAWHVQAKAFGGFTAKTLRALDRVHLGIRERRSAEPAPAVVSVQVHDDSVPRVALKPGARLVREWRGRTHIVDVTQRGYLWNGEEHHSLSIVARKITGARWSGPRFFGL